MISRCCWWRNSFYLNQFVQEAVLQCVQTLSDQQPNTRVGLITFNYQVKTPFLGLHSNYYTVRRFYTFSLFCFSVSHMEMQLCDFSSLPYVCVARWQCMDVTVLHHVSWAVLSWLTVTIWNRLPPLSPIHIHSHRLRTICRNKFWSKRKCSDYQFHDIASYEKWEQSYHVHMLIHSI